MQHRTAISLGLGITTALALAPAAVADPVGFPVSVTVQTTFDDQPDAFTSTVPGCEAGLVADEGPRAHYTPWGGTFSGIKRFTCDSGSGFAVRLQARFGEFGSTGRWTLVVAWGDYAGTRGSGSLVGVPFEGGITDAYTGTVR